MRACEITMKLYFLTYSSVNLTFITKGPPYVGQYFCNYYILIPLSIFKSDKSIVFIVLLLYLGKCWLVKFLFCPCVLCKIQLSVVKRLMIKYGRKCLFIFTL